MDQGAYYDPASNENDRVYCKKGGYLGPLAYFDPLEHGIMPRAVEGGTVRHRQHRARRADELLLERLLEMLVGEIDAEHRAAADVDEHLHVGARHGLAIDHDRVARVVAARARPRRHDDVA